MNRFAHNTLLFELLAFMLLAAGPVALPTAKPEEPTEELVIVPNGMIRGGWAFEVLDGDAPEGRGVRRDNWRVDATASSEWAATEADYKIAVANGDDRGHYAAADNHSYQAIKDRTFDYANCGMQEKHCNRGVWKSIETYVRALKKPGVRVFVATGPVFKPEKGRMNFPVVGPHQVWRPTHYAKAIAVHDQTGWRMQAWLVPNARPESTRPDDYLVSVDAIEFASGQNLFAWLDEALQSKLEK